jgi:glyoxylase-like metal-dependent hydrolase (beta-lactamase superfamily II)
VTLTLPPVPPTWASGQVTDRAHCVLAPNPGVMTLDGTNTWVLREPGAQECIVVDPGPLDEDHLARVLEVVRRDGGRVGLTLLTHDHADHAEAAARFAELSGARTRAIRAIGTGHDDLADGDMVSVGGLDLVVVTTPGHTSDSVSFLLPAECALLTGDTILGRGTTVVAWPDGELAAYLASLARLEGLCGSGAVARILPGPRAAPARRRARSCATTWSTGPSGSSRCGPPSPRARGRRGRSSRRCMPMCRGPCGALRNGAFGRNWPILSAIR